MRPLLLALAVLISALPAAAQYDVSIAADIVPGSESSYPGGYEASQSSGLVLYDGRLFFTASNGESWRQLWAFDATTGQASLAADLLPGSPPCPAPPDPPPSPQPPDCNAPSHLAVYGGRLFFNGIGDQGGVELWAFDAASGEASLVADISTSGNGNSNPFSLTVYAGRLFFSAEAGQHGDGEHGRELWAYDATANEATLVADVRPGLGSSNPSSFAVYGGRLFFNANDGTHGRELWAYDATTDQTSLVADILPGSGDSWPISLTVYDGRLFFGATGSENGRELRAYDASTDEASLVADIFPGAGDGGPIGLTVYDDRLFFLGYSGEYGAELWAYDAATNTAQLVVDANPGSGSSYPAYMTEYDGRLFFVAASDLWVYDAATNEASPIDFYSGSDCPDLWPEACFYPAYLSVYDDRLFFRGYTDEYGAELWAVSRPPVANETSAAPQSVHLRTPHPNPAQDRATVTFEIAEAGPVRVEVLDVLGRRVALLTDGPVAAGEHALTWEADALPSGLYLVRLTAGDAVQTQRLTLAR